LEGLYCIFSKKISGNFPEIKISRNFLDISGKIGINFRKFPEIFWTKSPDSQPYLSLFDNWLISAW